MNAQARLFVDCRCDLAEGPFWHPEREELFWFDINAGRLYRANARGDILDRYEFGEPVSAAALVDHDSLLIASASGLIRLSISSGARTKLFDLEADNTGTRSNDCRVSPHGDWWIGTMPMGGSDTKGALYHFRSGVLTTLLTDVAVSNATCFSPDGSVAYFADTPTRQIRKVRLNPDSGLPVGDWEVFVDLTGQPGAPDGAVTDSEGFVWNAEYGGGRVVRYAPDGRVDRVVDLPCPNVTCPAFGGAELKTLYITTASQEMSPAARQEFPLSGGIFELDVDVAGVAETSVRL